jgi:hypothetical protein
VIEAGRARWRRRGADASPGIQGKVMVVAARREKGSVVAQGLRDLEAQQIAVKRERGMSTTVR